MGHLDEAAFERAIAPCEACGGTAFEIRGYLDHQMFVMLGESDRPGKWVHDGEKFVDGTYRVSCVGCKRVAFESGDCPRCHRAGGLAEALASESHLAVPKKCPSCKELELVLVGFAPAVTQVTAGNRKPAPKASALLGETGFHVVAVACDPCGWATVAESCPLCNGPGPLRVRP
jgi:hypothetical protein